MCKPARRSHATFQTISLSCTNSQGSVPGRTLVWEKKKKVEDKETSLTERWLRGSETREAGKEAFSLWLPQCLMMTPPLRANTGPHIIQSTCCPWCCHGYLLFAIPITYSTRSNNSQHVILLFTAGRRVSRTGSPVQTMCAVVRLTPFVDLFCLVCMMDHMKRHGGNLSLSQVK